MNVTNSASEPSMPEPSRQLTHVELTWLEKRIEHWIRFGRIAEERFSTAAPAS